jgi:hypothetical protein
MNYTLEVELDKMPEGWVCFAIGEGKPCIAPPSVADEIKTLVGKLDEAARDLQSFNELIHDQAGRIMEAESRLDKMLEWLACSPMSERLSQKRCDEFRTIVGNDPLHRCPECNGIMDAHLGNCSRVVETSARNSDEPR